MIQNSLNWELFSNGERNEVIEAIKKAIMLGGGFIVNSYLFSDLALTLSLEIEESHIKKLHKLLSQLLDTTCATPIKIDTASKKEWLIAMNISFAKGSGELKQEIPAVPG